MSKLNSHPLRPRTLLFLFAFTLLIAVSLTWAAAAHRHDARLNSVARCADAAVVGQDWTQADWQAAWSACWGHDLQTAAGGPVDD